MHWLVIMCTQAVLSQWDQVTERWLICLAKHLWKWLSWLNCGRLIIDKNNWLFSKSWLCLLRLFSVRLGTIMLHTTGSFCLGWYLLLYHMHRFLISILLKQNVFPFKWNLSGIKQHYQVSQVSWCPRDCWRQASGLTGENWKEKACQLSNGKCCVLVVLGYTQTEALCEQSLNSVKQLVILLQLKDGFGLQSTAALVALQNKFGLIFEFCLVHRCSLMVLRIICALSFYLTPFPLQESRAAISL